jgi:hypothetical protein
MQALECASALGVKSRGAVGRLPWKKRTAVSLVRIATAAAIFALVSAACVSAKPVLTTADTNLRKSPGMDSQVLTLIPMGTVVEVGKCNGGWCQTSLNGQDGYAIARNLGMPMPRKARRGPRVEGQIEYEDRPPVAYGPPVYYGYRPYPSYGYLNGWGWGYRGWEPHW